LNLCVFGALHRNGNIFAHFFQTLICRECAKHAFLFFKFSGRCPETHSLFVDVPKNNQGTIQKSFFVTFLKKGNAKNFYM
jgi:hypothetical protein